MNVSDTLTAGPQNSNRVRRLLPASQENAMKVYSLFSKLVRDEQGGEVLEYALIAGLIVIAAIAAITSVGTKVLGRWTSVQNSI